MRLYLYQQRHFLKYLIESENGTTSGQTLLPSMSLKKTLLELKKEQNIENLEAVYLCSQFGQYVIEQNIGSKPVFITTQGFESSIEVHRPVNHDNFTLSPKRPASILNSDYIFGVDENVSTEGKVEQAIDSAQLEVITAKLQMSEKQNIAIGLLNAQYNNSNEHELTQFFKQKGYRCFSSLRRDDLKNENYRWWRNILNAYIYPPFEDFLETLKEVFEVENEQLYILHHNEYKNLNDNNEFLDSSLSHLYTLKEQFKDQQQILVLDTEDFFILKPQNMMSIWNTKVAKAYCAHPHVEMCNIQPTQYILQDAWGTLNFGYETLNYEPGPMLMGKGLKLSFVDLLFYKGHLKESFLSQVSQIGSLQKIDELLMAYSKITGLSPKELSVELIKLFIFQIENQLLKYNSKEITITGDLALDIRPILQDNIITIKFNYVEHQPLSMMQKR